MTEFDRAFDYVIDTEKDVYTDNPHDSGGPTKWGVTLRSYSSFVGRDVTPEEMQTLTREQAQEFYLARYWTPLQCARVTDPAVATALFDTGVLYGTGTAALLAQGALSACGFALKIDGVLGDKSLDALNTVDRKEFFESFHRCILDRIESVVRINPKNEDFRKGWSARAGRLLTLGTNAPLNREVT